MSKGQKMTRHRKVSGRFCYVGELSLLPLLRGINLFAPRHEKLFPLEKVIRLHGKYSPNMVWGVQLWDGFLGESIVIIVVTGTS